MNDALSDEALVRRAVQGDGIAFSELVTRHYKRAVQVAYGMLCDRHDAEDVAQEAFARAFQRLKEFEGNSAFYTWLYRIVVNHCIDLMRRRKRERRVHLNPEEKDATLGDGRSLWPNFDGNDPHLHVHRGQVAQQLRAAFAQLPDIHQAVIVLREIEGMSYEDIAATLGIKKGTVMSRLFHARQAMQQHLTAARDHEAVGNS